METNVPNSQLGQKTVTGVADFLADQAASAVDFLNNTGKDINVTQYTNWGSAPVAGNTYLCINGSTYLVEGIVNANQIKVSNATDNSSITIPYRHYN